MCTTNRIKYLLLLVGILLSTSASAKTSSFEGFVVGITDGDTIKVMRDGQPVTVRLKNIDCPESKQEFGAKAKQFTASLCFRKKVKIDSSSSDRYKRILGDVFLLDGREVNVELVKAGYAWWYQKFDPQDKALADIENNARENHIGLWADSNPIAPWDFRRTVKNSRAALMVK